MVTCFPPLQPACRLRARCAADAQRMRSTAGVKTTLFFLGGAGTGGKIEGDLSENARLFRVRLFINHRNLAIFSNNLRFFYTTSLSIVRIISLSVSFRFSGY
jgi:hypothetical protein